MFLRSDGCRQILRRTTPRKVCNLVYNSSKHNSGGICCTRKGCDFIGRQKKSPLVVERGSSHSPAPPLLPRKQSEACTTAKSSLRALAGADSGEDTSLQHLSYIRWCYRNTLRRRATQRSLWGRFEALRWARCGSIWGTIAFPTPFAGSLESIRY